MNYSNILKKCVDELEKENPRLDYLKGMLEVLLEMSDKPLPKISQIHETTIRETKGMGDHTPADETTEEIPAFLRVR